MTVTLEQLHVLLAAGVKHGASDIHIRVGDPPFYRVRGQLAPLKYDKLTPAHTRAICELIIQDPEAKKNVDHLQEYDTSYSLPGVARFRVNIHRQRGSLSLILRIIPTSIPTIEELGLPPVLRQIAEYERGLILVTGTTGAGKSSTLAAMIRHINETRRVHILTIEDPIEFLHTNQLATLTQREIGLDTRNFNVALRAALRMDPDVILVGEMRDAESVDIALKAAETGHVVFSTVHTTDAAKTLGRLIGTFPPEEQFAVRLRLADTLRATISQRLLPRADGKGRCVAAEVMIVTGLIVEYLRDPSKGTAIKDLIERGRSQHGMQSFDQHLVDLYKSRVITLETAIAASSNPSDFQRSLSFELPALATESSPPGPLSVGRGEVPGCPG
jgi:twitching motility protein PilT